MSNQGRFDIRAALIAKEHELLAAHDSVRLLTGHGPTVGDNSEARWLGILRGFLPSRYACGPIQAVDRHGNLSEQIDVAIYDRHFSPLWFGEEDKAQFVPVESVYAVFEVKPAIDATTIGMAAKKVASVRGLERTTTPIAYAGGTYQAVDLTKRPILGGILAAKTGWVANNVETNLKANLPSLGTDGALNLGIALDAFAFDYTPIMEIGEPTQSLMGAALDLHTEHQLIRFACRLFRLLQAFGSVPAIDMALYEAALDDQGISE